MRMLHKFFQDKVGLQGYWRLVKATYTLLWGTTVYYYRFFEYESIPESHDLTLGYVMLDVLCFPKQTNVVINLTLSLTFISMDIFVLVAIWISNPDFERWLTFLATNFVLFFCSVYVELEPLTFLIYALQCDQIL